MGEVADHLSDAEVSSGNEVAGAATCGLSVVEAALVSTIKFRPLKRSRPQQVHVVSTPRRARPGPTRLSLPEDLGLDEEKIADRDRTADVLAWLVGVLALFAIAFVIGG